jgi:hypothetical protein
MGKWDWNAIGSGVKAGSTLFGMLGANTNQKRQYGQTKRLMGLQNEYQRGLNQQGHDLQMDMWNKTNYGAQLQHMKDAGLNPGLMYGMGGGGGTTTGSQGGGSQSMGGVEQQKNMGIEGAMAIAQMELVNAQKKNVEADTQNKIDQNPNIGKQGENLDANTNKQFAELQSQLIQNSIDLGTAVSRIEGIIAEEGTKVIENNIKDQTQKDIVLRANEDVKKITSEITKNNAQEKLSKVEARIKSVEAEMGEEYGTFKGDDIRLRTVKGWFTELGNGIKSVFEKYKEAKGIK